MEMAMKIVNLTYFESVKLRSVFWREAKKAKSHHPIENLSKIICKFCRMHFKPKVNRFYGKNTNRNNTRTDCNLLYFPGITAR
jgi:hypothetical protein